MALDFEQLTNDVIEMARSAGERRSIRDKRLDEIEAVLREHQGDAAGVERFVSHIQNTILSSSQFKPFGGSAYPLQDGRLIGFSSASAAVDLPEQATLIAIDGSQIVPDRHAAFVYYLINIGAIIFHHGQGAAPEEFNQPTLRFPAPDELDNYRFGDGASVSVERDLTEISTLAMLTGRYHRGSTPTLAIMDQRLLYVPIGELGPAFKRQVIGDWQEALNQIRAAGGWIIGYVDRPGKASVLTLLKSFTAEFNPNEPDDLGEWDGLVDAELFARLLSPGERSAVFVDLSRANQMFTERGRANEMCFFYFNVGRIDQANIARVDLPRWLAEDETAVAAIHALLLDQCEIAGRYPYVLARADEIAVVGRQDQADLEFRIARQMDAAGVSFAETAKQQLKGIVRGGKMRHG